MNTVRKILTTCVDILFPRDAHVAMFDTMDVVRLEILATHHAIHEPLECVAPFPYTQQRIKYAIQAAKYHGHERASSLLGTILTPYVAEELSERRMYGAFHTPVLIPIPLHIKRLRERGFNQTERIARALLEHLSDERITLDISSLVRIKDTKHQTQQEKKRDRAVNLKDAFTVCTPTTLQGKDVILLDDVVTTGATLSSAKSALQKAGVRNILCIAVAH